MKLELYCEKEKSKFAVCIRMVESFYNFEDELNTELHFDGGTREGELE